MVVGGGELAARKVDSLLLARAEVTVVAPGVSDALGARVDARGITWRQKSYESADLADVALVFTATGVPEVDQAVSTDATARGLFVNSADDPANCSFFLTAVVRRDPVLVSISTSGASPGLASYLRRRLEAQLEAHLGDVAMLLGDVRSELHTQGTSTEGLDWEAAIGPALFELIADGKHAEARRFVLERLS